jgi:DivIVA domain-containing protein
MSPESPLDATGVARRQFSSARRGYDPDEVRAFLREVGEHVDRLARAVAEQRERAEAAEARAVLAENLDQLDQHRLVELVGEETTRVLETARHAAADIRTKAEESAARLVRQGQQDGHDLVAAAEADAAARKLEILAEAEALRAEAQAELDRRRAEGDVLAADIRREAEDERGRLLAEGEEARQQGEADAVKIREAAGDEGRVLVAEAQSVRERVLRDLARRRRAAREQVERLSAARERLLAAYAVVRRTIDDATTELTVALPAAKVASDVAMRRVRDEPEPTVDDLEAELSVARMAGLIDGSPRPGDAPGQRGPEAAPADADDESAAVGGPAMAGSGLVPGEVGEVGDDVDAVLAGGDAAPGGEAEADVAAGVMAGSGPSSDEVGDEVDEVLAAGDVVPGSGPLSGEVGDEVEDILTGRAAAPPAEAGLAGAGVSRPSSGASERDEADQVDEGGGTVPAADDGRRPGGARAGDRVALDVPDGGSVAAGRATGPDDEEDEAGLAGLPSLPTARHDHGPGERWGLWPFRRRAGGTERVHEGPDVAAGGPGGHERVTDDAPVDAAPPAARATRNGTPPRPPEPLAGAAAVDAGADDVDTPVPAEVLLGVDAVDAVDAGAVDAGADEASTPAVGADAGAADLPPGPTDADAGDADAEAEAATLDSPAGDGGDRGAAEDVAGDGAPAGPAAPDAEPVLDPDIAPGAGDRAGQGQPAGRPDVDELFARIRAGRGAAPAAGAADGPAGEPPAAPASAESAANEDADSDEAPSDAVPAAASDGQAEEPASAGSASDRSDSDRSDSDRSDSARSGAGAGDPDGDAALLRQRDATLEDVERALARRLKRVLADDQNEVFDLLRRAAPATVDDLVPERSDHVGRYAGAAVADLMAAAGHGAAAVGGEASAPRQALATELGEALVQPMRQRIARSLDESGGDLDEVTARLRALYREWKGQHIGDAVHHYAAAAFAAGALDAAPTGVELRWLVDRTGESCPDADDNALARGVRRGDPFPTGDHCAPAHPGCRCLVVPVTTSPRG